MNIAVLGLGKIATKSLLPASKEVEEVRVVALGTRTEATGERYAQQYDCEWASYDGVVSRSDVEGVYIALPNHLHFYWARKALEAGKHVLCEKPLALKEHEAEALRCISRERGLVLMEAFMYRFHPQHAEARTRIASGDIGEVRAFEASFQYSLDDLSNIRLRKECGGGALNDVGCYGIDSARFVLGAEPLKGVCFSRMGDVSGVDEVSTIQLLFPSGVQAQIRCGTDLPREQAYRVYGSLGSIEVPQAYVPAPYKTTVVKVHTGKQEICKIEGVNQYAEELRAFCAVSQGRAVDISLISQGYENSRIIERLRGSSGVVDLC